MSQSESDNKTSYFIGWNKLCKQEKAKHIGSNTDRKKTKQTDVTGTGINHFSSGLNQLPSVGALENFNFIIIIIIIYYYYYYIYYYY